MPELKNRKQNQTEELEFLCPFFGFGIFKGGIILTGRDLRRSSRASFSKQNQV